MKRFEYFAPKSLDEAVALLARFGGRADLFAGGTDVLVEIKERIRRPDCLIDIKKIPGMADLAYDAQTGLRFGALVTARQIETSPLVKDNYPELAQAARELGSIQIRNRATIVGNICRASPSADTIPPLIADGAGARIHGPDGERSVLLEDFFTGPGRTVLRPGEVVIEITIPPPPPRTGRIYIKHGRRKAMELATVGVAVSLTLDGTVCRDVRIVLGAVGPTPFRAKQAETMLLGHPIDGGRIASAARTAGDEARPISNVRSSAEYRREMVAVLAQRAIERAAGLAR